MTDQLDSPRVITNALGEVTSRRDFKPFGEEIAPESTYRTASRKYGVTDNIRQKFTGYQKDTETQLDFAEARMYQNLHGRFTAVDPLLASGKSANPQTFNRYVYCLNNPVLMTDPKGLQAGVWAYQVVTDKATGEGLGIVIKFFATVEKMNEASASFASTQALTPIFQNSSQSYGAWQQWTRGNFVLYENKTVEKLGDDGKMTTFSAISYSDEEWGQLVGDWYGGKDLDQATISRLGGDLYDSTKETNGFLSGFVSLGKLSERLFGDNLDLTAENFKRSSSDPVNQAIFISAGANLPRFNSTVSENFPLIKPGASGGPTAFGRFGAAVKREALAENPNRICVFCRQANATQFDHAFARARGGNATIENIQLTCSFCNQSKGARSFPVNPAPGYTGPFPPPWWKK